MRTQLRWFPIVLTAIVGGFASAALYPLFCKAIGAPVTGILGGIGAVAIGLSGAVSCGFGAMAPWKAWFGWFRDPQFIGIWAMVLLMFFLLLVFEIPQWRSGRWDTRAFLLPFLIGSLIVGSLIRSLFDGVVWVYGLLSQGNSGPKSVTQAKKDVCRSPSNPDSFM
jgi:hypothetical protein